MGAREALRLALGVAVAVSVLRPLAHWTGLPPSYQFRLAAILVPVTALAWALAYRPRLTALGLALAAAVALPAAVLLEVDLASLGSWLAQGAKQVITAWTHGGQPEPGVLLFLLTATGLLVSLVVAVVVVRTRRPLLLVPLGTILFASAWLLHHDDATGAFAAFLLPVCLLAATGHLEGLAAGEIPSSPPVMPTIISVALLVGLAAGAAGMLPGHFRPISLGQVADWLVDAMPFLADLRGQGEADEGGRGGGFSIAVTGFGGEPQELGGPIRTDDDIALELYLANSPPGPLLYLRGSIRDVYTGRGWKHSPRRPVRLADPGIIAFPYPDETPTWQVGIAVRHIGLRTRVVFSPLHPVAVEGLPQGVSLDESGNLWAPRRVPARHTYRVLARVPWPAPAVVSQDPHLVAGDEYLQLPADLPARVRELAQALTRQAGDALARARAIQAYLRRIPYAEDPPGTPRHRDFVDFFLFDLRRGYCTYHSTAMVVLLRSAGVAARWVEGFAVPLPPAAAGPVEIAVANKHAHAWVEAFIPGMGWFTFEPTPAFPEGDPALAPGFGGTFPVPAPGDPDLPRRRWEPGEGWGDLFLDLIEAEMPGGTEPRPEPLHRRLWPAIPALLAIAAARLAWLATRRAQRLWRLTRPRLRDRPAAIAAAYQGVGHYLSLLGAVPAAADTPAEYLARGRRVCPSAGQELAALTGIYELVQFGPGTPGLPEVEAAMRAARAIREEVRKALGGSGPLFWRLLAGPAPPAVSLSRASSPARETVHHPGRSLEATRPPHRRRR